MFLLVPLFLSSVVGLARPASAEALSTPDGGRPAAVERRLIADRTTQLGVPGTPAKPYDGEMWGHDQISGAAPERARSGASTPGNRDSGVTRISGAAELLAEERGDGASQILIVDSGLVEPAVPLDLSLKVQVFAPERLLEITATIRKRPGYPADLFFDKDVRVRITLPPGFQLDGGSLTWSGDLKGEQVGEFIAKIRAVHDTEGVIEAAATGHAVGGRVDADTERFHVVVKSGRIHVSREPPTTFAPLTPGSGVPGLR